MILCNSLLLKSGLNIVISIQRAQCENGVGGDELYRGDRYLSQVIEVSINSAVMLVVHALDMMYCEAVYLWGLPPDNPYPHSNEKI